MDEFFEALFSFEKNVILPRFNITKQHIEEGYLTDEDHFFIEYCLPFINILCYKTKNLIKENKNGRIKKTNRHFN